MITIGELEFKGSLASKVTVPSIRELSNFTPFLIFLFIKNRTYIFHKIYRLVLLLQRTSCTD